MEVTHHTHNLPIAPRKLRLVADAMRYKTVEEALAMLPLLPQKGAGLILKSVKSAVAMAKDMDADASTLVIHGIWCNEGRVMKRSISHSRGRMAPIMKRQSHLVLVLSGEPTPKKGSAKRQAAAKPKEEPITPAQSEKE